ncbi:Glycosyltransferase, group 1 family [Propionibacterium freudenreichii]|uniref:glycosyltransferase family 4 protein n=1 Tax=Propionibacterium freudenreichii TaxID=1744 RepID=UPI000BC354EA|nr:glycosyltransferase family 1 protein [Propionibacterium freudenreichii]SBN60549.1 Glycosyltransferase, group 1 family [Propionibacterium freudenreichii]SCQ49301.1 Glycosyltransferase, group 1 family [Propionibacterium freudenreichii]SCQ54654.1 Glycosyltransferase, group 1 family [Propionibacterium freudenreichii]
MRVAIVTESFLPQVNGVTNSVLRVVEQLRHDDHEALIVAPGDPGGVPDAYAGTPVITVPSVSMPQYPAVRIATATTSRLAKLLGDFAPDVAHIAAPLVLGRAALRATRRLGIPSVALFQTDFPTYLGRYLPRALSPARAEPLAWGIMRRVHAPATLTLAPSTATRQELVRHGFGRVAIWGRGVDTTRFAPTHRDEALHRRWAPGGECVVGFLGRLAPEKNVADLSALSTLPGTRCVIVGDGPLRDQLAARLPSAVFTGAMEGSEVARHMASFDIFVHPGELETFGQTLQEAAACAVPVIAPRRGGPIDIVRDASTGFLYPPGDLAAMRSQVARLVADAPLRRQLGDQAHRAMATRTWPRLVGQLVQHYRTAIRLTAHAESR